MSALPLRRYRVLATETRTLATVIDARSVAQAKRRVTDLWFAKGDDPFRVKDSTFDVVVIDKVLR